MYEFEFQRKILAAIMAFIMQNSGAEVIQNSTIESNSAPANSVTQTIVVEPVKEISVDNLTVSTISVSCLKVEWNAENGRDYTVTCEALDPDYAYTDNMYFVFKSNSLCYVTGLRENNEYQVTVEPILSDDEKDEYSVKSATVNGRTEKVEVIEEFPHEDGWSSAYAGERASGLRAMPASGAIYGSIVDPITGTGIRRDEYGDYCCAMGLFYGHDGDRFIVENQEGQQFTVKMCDSKGWADDGEGRYHWFGGVGNGKCIIEFIYDDNALPSCVAFSGSWGYYNWNGLDLSSNIKSIKKINYGETVEY